MIELAEAEGLIAVAEEQREAGPQKAEHLAAGWADLQTRLGQARERVRTAQRLLDDVPQIEAAVERLRELRRGWLGLAGIHPPRGRPVR